MKKFHFPLDRVLDFRRTQLRIEQAKLEQILSELGRIEKQSASVRQQFSASQHQLLHSASGLGVEFEALSAFRDSSAAQAATLDRARADCLNRLDVQRQRITAKEREVRLLEKLREDRFAGWKAARDREVDQQAEESFLARWGK